jgi:ABC-2 type transport system ATP-binding protein
MWDTIHRLVDTGSTVLLTTQYLDEADQLADRIAVIDNGKVVAEGTPNELKKSVGTAALQIRLRDASQQTKAAKIIEDILTVKVARSPEASELTAPMSNPDKVTDLLVALRAANIYLDEMSVQKPTLDEVFMALTGHGADEKKSETDNKENENE